MSKQGLIQFLKMVVTKLNLLELEFAINYGASLLV